MDLIFFLLNLALVLSDALVILSFKVSMGDFRLLIFAFRLMNFLASLESLFHLCLSCLFVKGASNSVEQGTKGPSGCSCLRSSSPSRHPWSGRCPPLWGWQWRSWGLMFVILEKGQTDAFHLG